MIPNNQWAKGVSGNPAGRRKGSRNVKSVIENLLNDSETFNMLPTQEHYSGTPLEAICGVLIAKGLGGDLKSIDLLFKYGLEKDAPAEKSGFFEATSLVITVIGQNGVHKNNADFEITPDGQLVGY